VEKIRNTALKASKGNLHSARDQLSRRLPHLMSIVLIILPLLIYWQVQNFEFVNLDDPLYITENPTVQKGLTKEGIIWAFAFNDVSYWHPVTWLSHMLDCQLYGLDPRGHHFNNVLLHIASTLLLFLSLKAMTGQAWKSAAVAAIFSLHPLNVESVAWVANRKGVLSTFFWMLALWNYTRYAKSPRVGTYMMVIIPFVFGLLSKPTVVTLPFALLLLDYWPLGRLRTGKLNSIHENPTFSTGAFRRAGIFNLVAEKIPLIALSAASVIVSFMSSRRIGIIVPTETLPLWVRIQNALASYLAYIGKMFLPFDLAVFYPFAKTVPLWRIVASCIVLLTVTVLAVRFARKRPYFAVGWFWYLGTLLPVIGLVQQGLWPAFADRFAYIPLIGLFISAVWGISDLVGRSRLSQTLGFAAGSLAVLVMGIGAWMQTGYWKNSIMLFEHALAVTKDNHLAHYGLGQTLEKCGDLNGAVFHFSKALQIMPENAQFHDALGAVLLEQGKTEEAVAHLSKAVELVPDYAVAHLHLGNALSAMGLDNDAIAHYLEAARIKPFPEAHHNLGLILASQGKFNEALYHYKQALKLKPDYAQVHNDLGVVLFYQGKTKEAILHFKEALRIRPNYENPRRNLDIILRKSS
jgi:tetratricopeptide (TPR) repeat protein